MRYPGSRLLWPLLLAVPATACRKNPRDLPLGAECQGDPECASGICVFEERDSKAGACAQRCRMDGDDCPKGLRCWILVEHGGKSVPVCGKPPPIPLGDEAGGGGGLAIEESQLPPGLRPPPGDAGPPER
jgi:hypothetical protein